MLPSLAPSMQVALRPCAPRDLHTLYVILTKPFLPVQAVRAIGRCAVTLERAAERCINVLLELIKQKVNYVVQESIVVIKDIFRRYPNRCAGCCRNLPTKGDFLGTSSCSPIHTDSVVVALLSHSQRSRD